ncbi:MAG: hypothetical protein CO094_07400 [Anaerolineae bacterium CG_4_9_14_3_um_filter_57_17]|nr:helix-turn-helix domain-containing protein [bacterium]NCT21085.1 helix-turn-helix domain-containing protein [bacterium]OIO87445.1 MAG: hypothetical protein AUK01_00030 [Anaerolineae bacterium CG2_30_57_67]PJB66405.1 MAG: hypothetical protein CO094_07400 [Anaerolineae bacterium CG_4_9_14_3_um_filter_57_17]
MDTITPLHTFDQIKLLADARRLAILRLLMAAPATLSQLGHALGKHPAWVQHHIKALEAGGLVELAETRLSAGVMEKFYRAKAGGFLLQELILPQGKIPTLVFSGSHDLALEALAERLRPQLHLLALPVGSLDGLINLRQGLCQVSGAHILDENGEYNLPTVRRIFPEQNVRLMTLATRAQGLMVAPGNPLGIRSLEDLTRADVVFLNRNPGSGTRIWLERELARRELPISAIRGYENCVPTHSQAAEAIRRGQADVSLGIQAAAQNQGIGFLPLFEERYDLIIPLVYHAALAPLLDALQTASFRHAAESLTGYTTTHSGEQISL